MKKIILAVVLMLGVLQADGIVYYDTQDTNTPIDKPNHPSTDIY
ncbi:MULTISPECIES: hypothetical protein [unclassified Sulfurimonas]|jgi:hypothetical protein|nr:MULTISPECIES: hypothetical protein [unclassified Sulfurimonas]